MKLGLFQCKTFELHVSCVCIVNGQRGATNIGKDAWKLYVTIPTVVDIMNGRQMLEITLRGFSTQICKYNFQIYEDGRR